MEYFYPAADEQEALRRKGVPVFCGACGALLPQRRTENADGKVVRGGGRLREFCPNPGEPMARSRTVSCRTMASQLVAVDRYLPDLPYPDTAEGRGARENHEALLIALRNTLHAAGLAGRKRPGKAQLGLFSMTG